MSCEMPLDPNKLMNSTREPLCPGDSGIVQDQFADVGKMVEQRIPPARWEQDWVEGECEVFGNSGVVFARALKQEPCPDAD